ncbi:MAG: cell surface protein SprA [Bacteroidales bacterium]|nr:cell surface protein SprA [Bacteroidales bacterium]
MYLKGVADTTVLRFASIELVRGDWRRYERSLIDVGESTGDELNFGNLEVSSVNIEENASKEPIRYLLPPGFSREIDPSNPQLRQLNEQSMVLRVKKLADGDARAVYKNTQLDLRQYKNMKMEVHAENFTDVPDDEKINDNELSVFIRIGSDYTNNYYEYELYMKVTDPDQVNSAPNDDQRSQLIWPAENSFDIDLQEFINLKNARNELKRAVGSEINYLVPYSVRDSSNGQNRILTIRGNPNLGNIRTIMIGVRNTRIGGNDDARPKSGELWVNELRLTDFKDKGGWAANARLKANLADFGNVSFAISTSTPGFGGIEQKVNERSQETMLRYDISSNFELGKFFPEKTGITIPFYAGYSKASITPEYNPTDPDILMKDALDKSDDQERLKQQVQDVTEHKSFNFTNVKVGKPSSAPKIYSPSNFSATYAWSQTHKHNIKVLNFEEHNYKAALNYSFNNRPKNITPLKNVKALRPTPFRIIRDFNFYYLPTQVGIRGSLDRNYSEMHWRDLKSGLSLPATYVLDYNFNRYYDVKFDLSRTLKLDYAATMTARIDEKDIDFGSKTGIPDFGFLYLEPYLGNDKLTFTKFIGRPINFSQDIRASWNVPVNKLPMLDWTNLNAQYNVQYSWTAGPGESIVETEDGTTDTLSSGNTISNNYRANLTATFRMQTLYNKVGVLKRIDDKYSRGKQKTPK